MNYEQRLKIISNIKGVAHVKKQESIDYTNNLRELKPDYVVHGDDWKEGVQKKYRENVISVLGEWGGLPIHLKHLLRFLYIFFERPLSSHRRVLRNQVLIL